MTGGGGKEGLGIGESVGDGKEGGGLAMGLRNLFTDILSSGFSFSLLSF